MPPVSPAPRRIATPSWLNLRVVLGVVLVLASVLIGARLVAAAHTTDPAVAVTRDLAAGTVLTASDVQLMQVQLPHRGAGVYTATVADAVGKRLQRPVARGELLPVRAVAEVPAQTTVSVPLAADAAPDLRAGQRIEVWVSTTTCTSVVLLPDVTVQSVRADDAGSFGGGNGAQNVVISVAASLADRVVQALALPDVKLRAGVLIGTAASSSSSSAAGPGDLSACRPAPTSPTR